MRRTSRRTNGYTATNIPRQWTSYIRNRLDQALSIGEGRYDKVEVSFAEGSDASGASTCRIRVRLVPAGIWIIQEARNVNPRMAIDNAAAAIARFLARDLAPLEAGQSPGAPS